MDELELKIEVESVWRCAVSDMIASFDVAFTHPLKNSKRKAERELGEKVDELMQRLFHASRAMGPNQYSEAVRDGKALIALAKESVA